MKLTALRPLLTLLGAATLSLSASTAQAAAPEWTVEDAASEVIFSGTHADSPFEGRFTQWNSRISFDPKQLKSSRIIIVVATGSAKTGDTVQESALTNDEWFNPADYPTATFASGDIRSTGGGNYVANGTFTLKGKKVPMSLPFTVKINGKAARAQGTLELDRIALGLGLTSDPNAEWVSRTIKLSFSLTATR